jgi:hypothetical protein
VPSTYADLLGIEDMQTTVRTADGQEYQVATYLGQLTIVGIDEPLRVRFLTLGDEFLLGRRVLDRYRVTFDRGQQVIVER